MFCLIILVTDVGGGWPGEIGSAVNGLIDSGLGYGWPNGVEWRSLESGHSHAILAGVPPIGPGAAEHLKSTYKNDIGMRIIRCRWWGRSWWWRWRRGWVWCISGPCLHKSKQVPLVFSSLLSLACTKFIFCVVSSMSWLRSLIITFCLSSYSLMFLPPTFSLCAISLISSKCWSCSSISYFCAARILLAEKSWR